MAIKRVFKSTISSCQYFFKSGKQAAFINHEFMTDIEAEIAELESEIGKAGLTDRTKSAHPHIYIDPDKNEVDTDKMDPISQMREKIRQEERERILVEMAAATNPGNDRGNTEEAVKLGGMLNSVSGAEITGNTSTASPRIKLDLTKLAQT